MIEPKLRFKRDDGTEYPAWEANQLGNIASYLKGAPLSKSDICDDGTPLILYGELYTTYGEVATDIVRRTKKTVSDEYLSRVGDVLIPTSGETPEEISTATCVMVPGVILAGDLYIVRNNVLNGCVLSFILNYQVNGDITKIAQGKSIVHLRWDDLKKIVIKYPFDIEEQQKIAAFLSDLDAVISASEAEVAALEQQKKSAMQKIFSQEVRFRRDNGTEYPEWKRGKFLDLILKITDFRGRTPKKLGMDWSEVPTNHRALSAVNVKKGYIDKSIDVHYGDEALYQKWMKGNELYLGQVLFTTEAPMGNVAQVPDTEKYILSQRTIAFTPKKDKITDTFLKYLLLSQFTQKSLELLSTGGTAQGVSQKSLAQLVVEYPCCIEEQQKIADFLSSFDEAIVLAQQELEKWKLLKKGLMQQMFV